MQPPILPGAGIDHPEVGLLQVEVTPHQGEQASQNHRLELGALCSADDPPGELLRVCRHIDTSHHAYGPVLGGLGDRSDGMFTHGWSLGCPG